MRYKLPGAVVRPLNSPLCNLREIAKQLLLLENHLFQPDKRCKECIAKHFLMCEALAEEALTLDKRQQYAIFFNKLANAFRQLHGELDKGKPVQEVAQSIRGIRKLAMQSCR